MLKEIIEEVELALDAVYKKMVKEDPLSYVLLIGRADVDPIIKNYLSSECVIDYQLDRYYDETREGFYLRYLNRNYKRDGFHYEGIEGIDDLSIEMMIYDHLWDSTYFLKSLVRISAILTGKGYIWKPEIPENGKWTFLQNQIINPLKNNGVVLGDIVEKGYSSDIRNAFAHALYNVDIEHKTITLRPKRTGDKTISFDDFQRKFLYSVILMNKMQIALEQNHNELCRNGCITKPFLTPDGIKVQVKAEMLIMGDKKRPAYKIVRIVED